MPTSPASERIAKISDVVTPLTFSHLARSWYGAYEGWIPSAEAFFGHVQKTLDGLAGFYMAGQWAGAGQRGADRAHVWAPGRATRVRRRGAPLPARLIRRRKRRARTFTPRRLCRLKGARVTHEAPFVGNPTLSAWHVGCS
jgi:hypothetical protein